MSIALPHNQSGFSLIEMLVSLALFATVVTASMGTLLVLVDANAKAQSLQIAVNNIAFAIDAMTRQIRTGTEFYCDRDQGDISSPPQIVTPGVRDCTNNVNSALAFTDTRSGNRVAFALEAGGTKIQRRVGTGDWLDLTGDNLRITQLDFWVAGTDNTATGDSDDTVQPSVTVFIEAEVGNPDELGTTYQLQTTVVQRKYDL